MKEKIKGLLAGVFFIGFGVFCWTVADEYVLMLFGAIEVDFRIFAAICGVIGLMSFVGALLPAKGAKAPGKQKAAPAAKQEAAVEEVADRFVPEEIFDSARIDGVGFWRELFQIILPMIWPTLTTLIVFSMTGIFTNCGATMLLAPDAPEASTIGWYITRFTMSAGSGLTGEILNYPAAVGLIFTAISFPLIMFTKWLCDKITGTVEY